MTVGVAFWRCGFRDQTTGAESPRRKERVQEQAWGRRQCGDVCSARCHMLCLYA